MPSVLKNSNAAISNNENSLKKIIASCLVFIIYKKNVPKNILVIND